MAKQKPDELPDDVTFHGKSIDPDIQRKVDEYMDLGPDDEAEQGSADAAIVQNETNVPVTVDEAGTAPLLPTDELPDSVKAEPAEETKSIGKSIQVVHADEIEQPIDSEAAESSEDHEAPDLAETNDELDIAPENSTDETLVDTVNEELSDQAIEASESDAIDPTLDSSDVSTVDADGLAAPEFSEEPNYEGKTIADMDQASKLPLDDPETAQAIEDIIAADSDKLLEIEDAKKDSEPVAIAPVKKPKKAKKGNFFKTWFTTPLYRNLTFAVLALAIVAVAVVPTSRYYVLNSAGVRVSTSVRVLDESTSLPLKSVELTVADKSAKTDGEGYVKVEGVPLGEQILTIKKPAFAEKQQTVVLGWGSNPLGEFKITPIGSQYTIKATDFLSDKPITKGEVSFEEASAQFNDKGEAKLTVPNVDTAEISVTVAADNYRSETITVNTEAEQEYAVAMVPSAKHVFFSKRSGKVDLYKADVDGKNEEILLSGTGIERDDSLGIAPHPTKKVAAFSSSRENVRNKDGFLLNTLQLIDLDTKEVTKVAQSERVQIIDWVGDRLVYVKIAQGASQADTKRHRLMSYDIASKTETELASTNYFNDVLSVNGAIYYSPALYQVNGAVGLYKINADGSNKKTVFQKEVWNLFRTSFTTVSLSVGQDWYDLNLQNDEMKKVGGAPSVLKSRVYIKSPDDKKSVWIDERDGKTVLIMYDQATTKDTPIVTMSGIKNPIRWIDNDHIVFRVANGQETADFVLSIHGGEPEKIADVMNSYGIDRWYYF